MNKNIIPVVVGGLLLAFVAFGVWYSVGRLAVTNVGENTQTVLSVVTNFGQQMQNVTLLAPKEELAKQMQEAYGPYVDAALISKWIDAPATAPGRAAASPWPARVDVAGVEPHDDGSYTVTGNIVEVTSANASNNGATVYPVTLTLVQRNDKWLITEYKVTGKAAVTPPVTSLQGTFGCLVAKPGIKLSSDDCKASLAKDASTHYALDLSSIGTDSGDLAKGVRIRVTGTIVPIAEISSSEWNKYQVNGIVKVASVNTVR